MHTYIHYIHTLHYITLHYITLHTYIHTYIRTYIHTYIHAHSKVTSPSLPPAQGYASPSRKLVLPEIGHNYTAGFIYEYICIDCHSSILSHMEPELINNLICWNCKGCIGKSIGPVQYRFTIPSLLAQCHVAGSMPRCWLSAS